MEKNPSGSVSYLAKISEENKQLLGGIRHWNHLKIARKDHFIWITGFTEDEIHSADVKRIPFIELFRLADAKLYPLGKKVPIAKVGQLIWSPIAKGLRIDPISFNHNLFEVPGKIQWKLIPSENPQKTEATLIDLEMLHSFISSAPKVRLDQLEWVIFDHHKALVLGTPPLSMRYETSFWQLGNHYIPLGYAFQLDLLETHIDARLNPNGDQFILWSKESAYSLISKDRLAPLSRSSVRRSFMKTQHHE